LNYTSAEGPKKGAINEGILDFDFSLKTLDWSGFPHDYWEIRAVARRDSR
jgi:hypothetical protein